MNPKYLSERKQYTEVEGVIYNQEIVTFGVPQGSTLGPRVFSIYTYNLPASVESGNVEMYADDTTIFCVGKNLLEKRSAIVNN